ncbi:STAS domain-containing protein [Actinomycetota bacterium Odt1-20B]
MDTDSWPHPDTPPHLTLTGTLDQDAVPRLCVDLQGHVRASPTGTVVVDVAGLGPPGLATLDALARAQLAARRAGGRVQLRNPTPALQALLDLAGFSELLGLVVEMERHPEQREPPLRVEEAVESGDAAL